MYSPGTYQGEHTTTTKRDYITKRFSLLSKGILGILWLYRTATFAGTSIIATAFRKKFGK
jgi:hypothetical protein